MAIDRSLFSLCQRLNKKKKTDSFNYTTEVDKGIPHASEYTDQLLLRIDKSFPTEANLTNDYCQTQIGIHGSKFSRSLLNKHDFNPSMASFMLLLNHSLVIFKLYLKPKMWFGFRQRME